MFIIIDWYYLVHARKWLGFDCVVTQDKITGIVRVAVSQKVFRFKLIFLQTVAVTCNGPFLTTSSQNLVL